MVLPVPITVYQTPGEVVAVTQKGASVSIVAPTVDPAVVEGTARRPIALVHRSFAGCAFAVSAVEHNTQENTRAGINSNLIFFFINMLDRKRLFCKAKQWDVHFLISNFVYRCSLLFRLKILSGVGNKKVKNHIPQIFRPVRLKFCCFSGEL